MTCEVCLLGWTEESKNALLARFSPHPEVALGTPSPGGPTTALHQCQCSSHEPAGTVPQLHEASVVPKGSMKDLFFTRIPSVTTPQAPCSLLQRSLILHPFDIMVLTRKPRTLHFQLQNHSFLTFEFYKEF